MAETGQLTEYMEENELEFYEAISNVLINLDETQNEIVKRDILIPSFSKSYSKTEFPNIIEATGEFEEKEDRIESVDYLFLEI